MYGGQKKTEQQIQADNNFIQTIINEGIAGKTGYTNNRASSLLITNLPVSSGIKCTNI